MTGLALSTNPKSALVIEDSLNRISAVPLLQLVTLCNKESERLL
jgi:hypothetical protein